MRARVTQAATGECAWLESDPHWPIPLSAEGRDQMQQRRRLEAGGFGLVVSDGSFCTDEESEAQSTCPVTTAPSYNEGERAWIQQVLSSSEVAEVGIKA